MPWTLVGACAIICFAMQNMGLNYKNMGSLVDGVWVEEDDVNSSSGSFVRPESVFRHWVTKDGSPGPHGDGGFEARRSFIQCGLWWG